MKTAQQKLNQILWFLSAVVLVMLPFCSVSTAQTGMQKSSSLDGMTPSGMAPGTPAGSFPLSGFESVNPYNGHLNVALPLLRVGGRGDVGYTITLSINHPGWQVNHERLPFGGIEGQYKDFFFPQATWWNDVARRPEYTPGRLIGRVAGEATGANCQSGIYYSTTKLNLHFVTADGSEIELRDTSSLNGGLGTFSCAPPTSDNNRGRVFTSRDGSFATFISDTMIYDSNNSNLNDSSASVGTFVYPTGYLLMKDGTRYRIVLGKVEWMRDRNGNQVKFGYSPCSHTIGCSKDDLIITDALNRTITVEYDVQDSSPYGLCDRITYNGFNGQPRVIRISFDYLSTALRSDFNASQLNTNLFPQLDPVVGQYNAYHMATRVWLPPDAANAFGKSYKFKYNPYQELARIELPTGGAFEYDYIAGNAAAANSYAPNCSGVIGRIPNAPLQEACSGVIGPWQSSTLTVASAPPPPDRGIYRRVEKRRFYPNGGSGNTYESLTTFSLPESQHYAAATPVNNLGYAIVETFKLGSATPVAREKHYYYGSPMSSILFNNPFDNPGWTEGKEWKSEVLATDASASVLRCVETGWDQQVDPTSPNPSWSNHPRIYETVTKLLDGGANKVTKRTALNPQTSSTAGSFDAYNNQLHLWEYDYGNGAPPPAASWVRRTQNTYELSAMYTALLNTSEFVDNVNPDPARTIHIRGLLLETCVYNASNVLVAKTNYEYDQYNSAPTSGNNPSSVNMNGLIDRPGIASLVNRWGESMGYMPTYDTKRGNPTKVVNWLLPSTQICVYRQYDVAGNVARTRDPEGRITETQYMCEFAFPSGQLTPKPDPLGVYGASTSLATAVNYDCASGRATSATDENGQMTMFEYNDPLDRLSKIARPDGGQTMYLYGDAVGSLYLRTKVKLNATTTNYIEDYALFDGAGRAWRKAHQESSSSFSLTDTRFDALGRVEQVSNPFFSSTYNTTSSGSEWTVSNYDALSRVTQVTTPDGACVKSDYAGCQVMITDQSDKKRISETDALGRLKKVWEVDPNQPGAITLNYKGTNYLTNVTEYNYDVLDNLCYVKQSTQSTLQERFFLYDSLSRLTRAHNPEQVVNPAIATTGTSHTSWTMAYAYDMASNLTSRTDARNIVTNYTYDALNRNIKVDYSDTTLNPDITRYFDNASAGAFGKGRLYKSYFGGNETSTTGTVERTMINGYDVLGRPLAVAQGFKTGNNPWVTYTVTDTYDCAGNLCTQNYPVSGRIVTTNYVPSGTTNNIVSGRIASMTTTLSGVTSNLVTGLSYAAFGGLLSETYGNNAIHSMSYNSRLQPTSIKLGMSGGGTNPEYFLKLEYLYGTANNLTDPDSAITATANKNNGNVARIRHYINGVAQNTQTYQYDALNRLLRGVEHNGTTLSDSNRTWYQGFQYDNFGNRGMMINASDTYTSYNLSQGRQALQLADLSNATNRITRSDFIYDAAGNLTNEPANNAVMPVIPAKSYTFDGENRIKTATVGGVTHSYCYNADGQRVRRTVNGVTTFYIYDAAGRLMSEINPSNGAWLKEYVYKGSELLAAIEPGTPSPVCKYATSDHLGMPRVWTKSSGSTPVVDGGGRHDYAPFGEELVTTATMSFGAWRGASNNYGSAPQADGQRRQFNGKERDTETGLDYFGARYYGSLGGRFISPDPIPVTEENFVNPQRWNLYVFVNNNPLSSVDPNGADGLGQGGDKVISVFLLTSVDQRDTGKAAPNWDRTKQIAERNGYKLNIVTPDSATPDKITASFKDALQKSEVVVLIQHGGGEYVSGSFVQQQITVGAESYSPGSATKISADITLSGIPSVIPMNQPVSQPETGASVVCNFSCDSGGSKDVPGNTTQYFNFTGSNQTVVDVNSGRGGVTSVGTLEAAANSFVRTYATTKGNVARSVQAANSTVRSRRNVRDEDNNRLNADGDRVQSRRVN